MVTQNFAKVQSRVRSSSSAPTIMKPNYIYLDFPGNLEATSNRILGYLFKTGVFQNPGNWMGPLDLGGLWEDVPELKRWLDSMNLEVEYVAVLGYFQDSGIHIDEKAKPRINFPVRNTQGTATTNFYQLTNLIKTLKFDGKAEYWDLTYDTATIIDSYELTQPVLFNPNVPHKVSFNQPLTNKNPRLALTINFIDAPYYMLDLDS